MTGRVPKALTMIVIAVAILITGCVRETPKTGDDEFVPLGFDVLANLKCDSSRSPQRYRRRTALHPLR
jgi:hypothetical protein